MSELDSTVFGIMGLLLVGMVALLIYAMEKIVRVADRYRLKYGYDREIEGKEFRNLDEREARFKKRVFKD